MGSATAGSGSIMSFLPLIILATFFYFFMLRPQKKRQQQMQDMKSSLKTGDKVVLYSGLVATIVSVNEDELVLQSEPDNVSLTFKNWAIREVLTEDLEEDEDDTYEEDEKDEE